MKTMKAGAKELENSSQDHSKVILNLLKVLGI